MVKREPVITALLVEAIAIKTAPLILVDVLQLPLILSQMFTPNWEALTVALELPVVRVGARVLTPRLVFIEAILTSAMPGGPVLQQALV